MLSHYQNSSSKSVRKSSEINLELNDSWLNAYSTYHIVQFVGEKKSMSNNHQLLHASLKFSFNSTRQQLSLKVFSKVMIVNGDTKELET